MDDNGHMISTIMIRYLKNTIVINAMKNSDCTVLNENNYSFTACKTTKFSTTIYKY